VDGVLGPMGSGKTSTPSPGQTLPVSLPGAEGNLGWTAAREVGVDCKGQTACPPQLRQASRRSHTGQVEVVLGTVLQ
jgi:hypothetical protein